MNRILVMALLAIVLALGSCGKPEVELPQGSTTDAIFIVIWENGISSDSSEVVVKNFYAGAKAEMVYRIHNATAKAIMPEIFLVPDADVSDYSRADGAVKAPDYVAGWVELPPLTDVNPGQIKDFLVALEMPKKTKKPAEKIGFQIGVAGKVQGTLQPAVGIWWILNMR